MRVQGNCSTLTDAVCTGSHATFLKVPRIFLLGTWQHSAGTSLKRTWKLYGMEEIISWDPFPPLNLQFKLLNKLRTGLLNCLKHDDVAGQWPATSSVHYTTSCNTQSSAPEDGQNNFPKHVELTGIINKLLLLHLVGCLYYLYQWCTVKQISDNEIYLLIKYIKSVFWRVAKRLSLYTGRTVPKG